MKNRKKQLALSILLAAVLLCLLLFILHFQGKQQSSEAVEKGGKEAFTLLCPKLDHCADAFLMYNDRQAVMIDTGEAGDADRLLEILRDEGIDTLDALILTHYDKDHIGGAPAILKAVAVKKCYMTRGTEDSEEYRQLFQSLQETRTEQMIVTGTEELSLLNAAVTIYPPLAETYEKNQDNNLSLIVSVKAPDNSLLFTGDAQKERVREYVEKQYDGTRFTWLKVPHHGRDKKPVKMLLNCFIPEEAVICSSEDEPENEKVVELLEEAGVRVVLTRKGDRGRFSVSSDGMIQGELRDRGRGDNYYEQIEEQDNCGMCLYGIGAFTVGGSFGCAGPGGSRSRW